MPGQHFQDRTAQTGLPARGCQHRTARIRLPGQDRKNRQDRQNRKYRMGQAVQDVLLYCFEDNISFDGFL
jgi:hypothetical protein